MYFWNNINDLKIYNSGKFPRKLKKKLKNKNLFR